MADELDLQILLGTAEGLAPTGVSEGAFFTWDRGQWVVAIKSPGFPDHKEWIDRLSELLLKKGLEYGRIDLGGARYTGRCKAGIVLMHKEDDDNNGFIAAVDNGMSRFVMGFYTSERDGIIAEENVKLMVDRVFDRV